jgi:hypothetical protein
MTLHAFSWKMTSFCRRTRPGTHLRTPIVTPSTVYDLNSNMSNGFPALLAWTFLGSFILGVLDTSRWKIILISVIAVWCMHLGQTELDLLMAGTTEAYAWFGFMSAGVGLLALAISAVGADLGAALLSLFLARNSEAEEMADMEVEEVPE